MKNIVSHRALLAGILLLQAGCALAQPTAVTPLAIPNMATTVSTSDLDPTALAQWNDGAERPIEGVPQNDPSKIIWTDKGMPSFKGLGFGDSKTPGPRYLRLGFQKPISAGSVLTRGGGQLSVLKTEAAYPGALNDDALWLPAQRLVDGVPSDTEVGDDGYAVWVLPPGTTTRAFRFTHTAQTMDKSYAGYLGAVFVMGERFADLAPQAQAGASNNNQKAARINNGNHDGWGTWDNNPTADSPVVSAATPQWLTLTWAAPVKLSALMPLWAGFSVADVQIYNGPADQHPRDASEADWQTVKSFGGIKNGYPIQLWPNRLDFGQTVITRAIRLRVTAPAGKSHPHVDSKIQDGRRIWLGELMALQPLGNALLLATNFPAPAEGPHPPIAVRFALKEAGFVTLVIEKADGTRVRNLVSETRFPAGDNVAWWDGTDDLGRDVDAAKHGLYKIPAQFVEPGAYRVRGLVRGAIEPRYEFSVYSPGTPPWDTADKTGAWLTNHTPAQAALFVPGETAPGGKPLVFLGSYVSEGGSGLAWVDLQGRKQGGRGWIGGTWTAAPYLARDAGPQALADNYAYVASVWSTEKGSVKAELRITGLTAKDDKPILRHEFDPKDPKKMADEISGLAARDGIVIVSLPQQKLLLLVDAKAGKIIGPATMASPRGLAFDNQGRLLVLAGTSLLRFAKWQTPEQLVQPQTLVTGLEDPQHVAVDSKGNFYISDLGKSHQVKVFDPMGKPVRTIGKPGVPAAGPYDPLHMNHPAGLAIDSNDHLWVTENDFLPKRVSVWTLDGKLWKDYFGPGKYGGGGTLDPQDKTRFYYADEGRGTIEFKLDWQKGEAVPSNILYRRDPADLPLAFRSAAPETVLYRDGKRYFTNAYNSSPTSGHGTAFLFLERGGLAKPVAAMGRAKDWDLLQTDAFTPRLPAGADWKNNPPFFVWSDANGDARVQPAEVNFLLATGSGMTVMPDLSFCVARLDGKAMRFKPIGFSQQGVPSYDLTAGEVLATAVQSPTSSGGDQVLTTGDKGWTVVTLGLKPFATRSLSGARDGQAKWSYPSLWPGLHASHEAPKPDRPGELIGTTRLLGGFVNPAGSEVGPLWAINSNMGHMYLFTADGLFVTTVFHDSRQGKSWAMPVGQRNMDLSELTLHDENFWPTMTQTPDGKVYIQDGGRMALVRLDGLDTLRRLLDADLHISADDLQKAQAYTVAAEAARQRNQGSGILQAALRAAAPVVNGKLDDWTSAAWVDIDKSGVGANFNSNSKPYDITGALTISGDRLYAAFRTDDDKLLQNTGELATAPFKTGGALDLMLGTNPAADAKRANPVEGDLRLLVTQAKGKTMAVLYRAVVPGTKTPVPFSSPWRTIPLDRVDDISDQVVLAGSKGNYEFSVPLAALGLKPQAGQPIRGDIGILRGNGFQTTARVYWSNKATGITADVPSEAMLTPQLWGRVEFKATP